MSFFTTSFGGESYSLAKLVVTVHELALLGEWSVGLKDVKGIIMGLRLEHKAWVLFIEQCREVGIEFSRVIDERQIRELFVGWRNRKIRKFLCNLVKQSVMERVKLFPRPYSFEKIRVRSSSPSVEDSRGWTMWFEWDILHTPSVMKPVCRYAGSEAQMLANALGLPFTVPFPHNLVTLPAVPWVVDEADERNNILLPDAMGEGDGLSSRTRHVWMLETDANKYLETYSRHAKAFPNKAEMKADEIFKYRGHAQ